MGINLKQGEIIMNRIKNKLSILVALSILAFPCSSFAAERTDNAATVKQQILQEKLAAVEKKLAELRKNSDEEVKNAIEALSDQLIDIRRDVYSQQEVYEKLLAALEKMESEKEKPAKRLAYEDEGYFGDAASTKYLVFPGPAANVSYTQDAVNSQGNSTMIFKYSPNQLYKIYCRVNYLTDIELKKGEHLSFVGGGDTSAWAVNSTIVDGTTHVYLKPVLPESTTNLIITTDKRSYQLILNTSDWYNPIVKWSYDVEAQQESIIKKARDEKVVTGTLNVVSPAALDFDYNITGSGTKPAMVFNDGVNTYIKFDGQAKGLPPLFVRAKDKKQVELVNYKVKDNYYIVDRLIDMAELRYKDNEKVIIKHR